VVRVLALRGRRLLATSPGRRLRVTPASGATIIGAHAVVLDPSVVSSARAPGAPGRLVYGGGDSVQAGEIIAIGVGPATPNGLLARATKSTTRGGQTVVSTVPATLLEALPEGSIEAVLPTANQRTARAAARGAPAQPFSCNGSASATITAQESLSASLVLKADWRAGGGLQSASLTANASATGSVAADAQAALTCALAKTRFEQFAGPKLTFRVDGLIPIVLSSQVSVYAEAHVTTAAAVRKRDLQQEVTRFLEVYNSSWERNWGFVPLNEEEVRHYAKDLKPVLDENWAMVAEKTDTGEVVGAALTLPDFNQVLARLNGRLLPFGWVTALREKPKIDAVRVFALGVKPAYQHTGVAARFYQLCRHRPNTKCTSTPPNAPRRRAARWAGYWRPTRR
jgi:hypothetical protein